VLKVLLHLRGRGHAKHFVVKITSLRKQAERRFTAYSDLNGDLPEPYRRFYISTTKVTRKPNG
jgi:hypothetical protein